MNFIVLVFNQQTRDRKERKSFWRAINERKEETTCWNVDPIPWSAWAKGLLIFFFASLCSKCLHNKFPGVSLARRHLFVDRKSKNSIDVLITGVRWWTSCSYQWSVKLIQKYLSRILFVHNQQPEVQGISWENSSHKKILCQNFLEIKIERFLVWKGPRRKIFSPSVNKENKNDFAFHLLPIFDSLRAASR